MLDDTDFAEFLDPPTVHRRHARKAEQRKQRRTFRNERPEKAVKQHKVAPLVAKNQTQSDLIEALNEADQVFAIGPAGTGKTYVAARHAMRRLLDKRTEKIAIARPTAAKKEHKLGFRPGDQNAKIADWLVPVMDGFHDEAGKATVEKLRKEGKIEFLAFETLRGRSLSNAIVWCDEAQNLDIDDLKLFLTRIGERSQVILTGDIEQTDIPNSGLEKVVDMVEEFDMSAEVIEFTEEDVVRSAVAKEWVVAFRRASDN